MIINFKFGITTVVSELKKYNKKERNRLKFLNDNQMKRLKCKSIHHNQQSSHIQKVQNQPITNKKARNDHPKFTLSKELKK